MPETLHASIETLLVLLLVVFAIAVIVQWVRLPYTIALVLAGLFGFQPGFSHIRLTPDLILLVFLPVLLFEGAYNVSARRLRQNLIPVTLLAVPGVLLGTAVTAVIVHLVIGLPWAVALLFGALISSTDPIAVVSLFKDLGAPRRLALLVEGESLFNDGTAITLFQILLVAVLTGELGIGEGVLRFVITVAGALAVGAVVGYGGSLLLRAIDNAQIQITSTVIAAYGAYLLAERFTFSGAIAVVVTALFFGNYGATSGLSPRSVHALSTTWEFLGFVANSLIFLLIGIELDPLALIKNWWPILIAFLAVLVGRICAVYLLTPLLRGEAKIPGTYRPVLVWGALRGAVSLALVLSLPLTLPGGRAFPAGDVLRVMAFGVVGISLVLQGLTMGPLIRRLGLWTRKESGDEQASVQARLAAAEGALLALTREHERGEIGGLQYERLVRSYRQEHAQLERTLRTIQESTPDST